MVVQTIKVINGNPFIYHYSDAGFYIERGGVLYADAIDLPQFEYRYNETTEPLEQEVAQDIATFAND